MPTIAGAGALVYGALVFGGWWRYGTASRRAGPADRDPMLDRFIPVYDVAERHQVRVDAPAAITLAAAAATSLSRSAPVRAIFRARQLALGARETSEPSRGLLAQVLALGWGVLDEMPGREIVLGAVTQPWQADVVFRAVPPERFAAFDEPGFVKIAWTLRADPDGDGGSIFRTQTRAVATDAAARARFRRYWAFVAPGVFLIRQLMLAPVKAEAERQARRVGT